VATPIIIDKSDPQCAGFKVFYRGEGSSRVLLVMPCSVGITTQKSLT